MTSLQEQLRVMNQALSSRDSQINEFLIVTRQAQAALPLPEAEPRLGLLTFLPE